jgi:kelch-like protein 1/4/5
LVFLAQFIADYIETDPLFQEDRDCRELIMEALKYHLLPERRPMLQSPRTRPRKSTVGALYAVGGMHANKGKGKSS